MSSEGKRRFVALEQVNNPPVWVDPDRVFTIRESILNVGHAVIYVAGVAFTVTGPPEEVARKLGLDWPGEGETKAEAEAAPPKSEAERIEKALLGLPYGGISVGRDDAISEDFGARLRVCLKHLMSGWFIEIVDGPYIGHAHIDDAGAAHFGGRFLAALGYRLCEGEGEPGAGPETEPPKSEAERIAEALLAAHTEVTLVAPGGLRVAARMGFSGSSPGGWYVRLYTPRGALDSPGTGDSSDLAARRFSETVACLGYHLAE